MEKRSAELEKHQIAGAAPDRARELVFLAGALVLTGFLRLMAVRLRGTYVEFDESMYITLGKNLLTGRGYFLNGLPNATFPFGISIIAGIGYVLTGSARWALNLPTVLFGTLAVVPVYVLMRDVWNRSAAAVAVIFYAGFPALLVLVPFRRYGEVPYAGSEAIFAFFILCAACLFHRVMTMPNASAGLAAGFFSGLAFEVRQDAAGYFAFFVVFAYATCALAERKLFSRRAAAAGACALVVFALLAAPFFLWVRHVTGRFYSGPRFAQTYNMRSSLDRMVETGDWGPALKDYFKPNPDLSQLESPYYGVAAHHRAKIASGSDDVPVARLLREMRAGNLPIAWRAFWRELMPRYLWVFALIGLASVLAGRRWKFLAIAAALVLPSVWVTLVLYVLPRFYIIAALAVLLIAASGADLMWRGFLWLISSGETSPRVAAAAYLTLPLVVSLWMGAGAIREARRFREDHRNFERALETKIDLLVPVVRENTVPGSTIIAPSPVVPLRAQLDWLAMPMAGPREIAEYARNRRAQYLLVSGTSGFYMHYSPDDVIRELPGAKVAFDEMFAGERFVLLDLKVAGSALHAFTAPGKFQKFIIITVDTLRKDHLGCYGYDLRTSPAIDRFASSAVRFDKAFSACPFTGPSMTAMLTSRFPGLNESTFANGYGSPALSSATLAEVFRQNFYRTAAFIGNFALRASVGPDSGFELYDATFNSKEVNRGRPERAASSLTAAATAWLDGVADKPFFMWIHYQDPHGPYTPPKSYAAAFLRKDAAPRPLRALDDITGLGGIPSYQVLGEHRDLNFYVAQYDGEIAFADGCIAALFAKLRASGIWDDVVIVVTADHGEAFGENGFYCAHGHSVGPELTNVPLIVRIPGVEPASSDVPVSLVDVAPTIVELAGFKRPDTFLGVSLTDTLASGSRGAPFFSETSYAVAAFEDGYAFRWGITRTMVGPPENKKVTAPSEIDFYNSPIALYNITNDVSFAHDIQDKEPTWARYFRGLCQEHLARSVAFSKSAKAAPLDERSKEVLRSLGYLNK